MFQPICGIAAKARAQDLDRAVARADVARRVEAAGRGATFACAARAALASGLRWIADRLDTADAPRRDRVPKAVRAVRA